MIIYKITNKINGMVYIGQTKRSLEARWKAHCAAVNSRISYFKLQKAIVEYGKESFAIEQIDVAATKDEADEKESYWIKHYNAIENGYNTARGGKDGGRRKRVTSVEDGLVFDSMIDAAKHYGRAPQAIWQAIKNPSWTCAGQHWKTV